MNIHDGSLNGEAMYRESAGNFDARYTVSNLNLDYKMYNVATIKLTWHVLFLRESKMKVAIVNLCLAEPPSYDSMS